MSKQKIISVLRAFQKASSKSDMRQKYFSAFEKKMLYRTTKTENPSVTTAMVKRVLHKLS